MDTDPEAQGDGQRPHSGDCGYIRTLGQEDPYQVWEHEPGGCSTPRPWAGPGEHSAVLAARPRLVRQSGVAGRSVNLFGIRVRRIKLPGRHAGQIIEHHGATDNLLVVQQGRL